MHTTHDWELSLLFIIGILLPLYGGIFWKEVSLYISYAQLQFSTPTVQTGTYNLLLYVQGFLLLLRMEASTATTTQCSLHCNTAIGNWTLSQLHYRLPIILYQNLFISASQFQLQIICCIWVLLEQYWRDPVWIGKLNGCHLCGNICCNFPCIIWLPTRVNLILIFHLPPNHKTPFNIINILQVIPCI